MQSVVVHGYGDSDAVIPQQLELCQGPVRAITTDLGLGKNPGALGVEQAGQEIPLGFRQGSTLSDLLDQIITRRDP